MPLESVIELVVDISSEEISSVDRTVLAVSEREKELVDIVFVVKSDSEISSLLGSVASETSLLLWLVVIDVVGKLVVSVDLEVPSEDGAPLSVVWDMKTEEADELEEPSPFTSDD